MSDEPAGRGGGLSWAMWIAILVPALYVLSVGPAAGFVTKTGVGREATWYVYAPLIWLHNNTPLREPLEWYVELWIGK